MTGKVAENKDSPKAMWPDRTCGRGNKSQASLGACRACILGQAAACWWQPLKGRRAGFQKSDPFVSLDTLVRSSPQLGDQSWGLMKPLQPSKDSSLPVRARWGSSTQACTLPSTVPASWLAKASYGWVTGSPGESRAHGLSRMSPVLSGQNSSRPSGLRNTVLLSPL